MANVTVTFGSDARANNAITPSWIRSAMDALERSGKRICGSVHVEGGGISVTLPVGACPSAGGGGGRPPNAAEKDVIDRWRRLHLDQPRVAPGEPRRS